MDMQKTINEYVKRMNLKFAKNQCIKIRTLATLIGRGLNYKRYVNGELEYTSQDLRSLVIAIEKVFKEMNKKIEFASLHKKLAKSDIVDDKALNKIIEEYMQYINALKYIQSAYSVLNYYEMVLYLFEENLRCEQKRDSEIFTKEVSDIITSFI